MRRLFVLAVFSLLCLGNAPAALAGQLEWVRQLGGSEADFFSGVAIDSRGQVRVTGRTFGDAFGPNRGSGDTLLAGFDDSGLLVESRNFGSASNDQGVALTPTSDGSVVIVGDDSGSISGANSPFRKISVSKHDESGNLIWSRQLNREGWEEAGGVAADADGNTYVAGALGGPDSSVGDAFLASYDASGELRWLREFGTSGSDHAFDVAVDGDANVYVTGQIGLVGRNSPTGDAFLAAYRADGTPVWRRRIASTQSDIGRTIGIGQDNAVYVGGSTNGTLGWIDDGSASAFLAKYDGRGALQWVDRLDSVAPRSGGGLSIALDAAGDVTVAAGYFRQTELLKLSPDGEMLWKESLDMRLPDTGQSISVDQQGNAYVVGSSWTSFSSSAPKADAVLAKVRDDSGSERGPVAREAPDAYLTLDLVAANQESRLAAQGVSFDTYTIRIVNQLGGMTSAELSFSGDFLNAYESYSFSSSEHLPTFGPLGDVPETFFVLPEGQDRLALKVEDTAEVLKATSTLAGPDSSFPHGESAVCCAVGLGRVRPCLGPRR